MDGSGSIDLLPKITEEEVHEIEKKGKINLSGVFFIFLFVLVSLVILGANLVAQLSLNSYNENLSSAEKEVVSLQYVEVKQKTLNNKMGTFDVVQRNDFRSGEVLEYLMEISESLSEVDSLYLDQNLQFEVTAKTKSYADVARLWHELSTEEDYFEYISLEYARLNKDKGVSFSFTGVVKEENLDKF